MFGLLAAILGACSAPPSSEAPATAAAATSPSAAAASSPPPSASAATPTPTATPIPTPSPTPVAVKVPSPLTGLPVSEIVAARHPIAVMIDDLRTARPQSGLSQASIVWQAPAEGGIPRYMAIFSDQLPKEIGPVRSARVYYVSWAAEWDALYAHSGGSPQALETLRARGDGSLVYDANEFAHGGSFYRVSTRFAPHNLYTSGTKLRRLAVKLGATDGPMDPAWEFGPDAPLDQRPFGGSIVVKYPQNTITYRYDRDTNTYLRSVTGEKAETDAGDRERIAPKNVVVMFAQFTDTGDAKKRLDADIVGSGKARISTNGRTETGTWKKASVKAPTQFFDASGSPVTLTAGQTFVQVVDIGTPVTIKAGSETPPTG